MLSNDKIILDFCYADWVQVPESYETALVRRKFTAEKEEIAELAICGLGFFELYFNGMPVTDEKFNPVWSDYCPRKLNELQYPLSDTFTHRIYFRRYKLRVRAGENCLALTLGNGWYRQTMRNVEGCLSYGDSLKCAFLLTGHKELCRSDANTRCRKGHIVMSNVYYGERHDFRLAVKGWTMSEYDDSAWANTIPCARPEALFEEQTCPADKTVEKIAPVLLSKRSGSAIYDAGENLSGYAVVRAFAGSENVSVRYAEELDEDGLLDFSTAGGEEQIQTDTYIFPPDGPMHPSFCIHGFRYFEVCGGSVEHVEKVHSDIRRSSSFSCADSTVNWYHDAFVRSLLSNMHAGVPSDCPHRERLGYTGDGQLAAEAGMLTTESRLFYRKWIRDICDCQDIATGHVQHTAPFYGGGGGPGGWGCAIVNVPYVYYKFYGEREIINETYPHMLRWVRSMEGFSENGLIVREYEGGWCLGDWCTPEETRIPEPLVNTYYFVLSLRRMARLAREIGRMDDVGYLQNMIAESERALLRHYCPDPSDPLTVQGADAFLIDLALADNTVLRRMAERYDRTGVFDTGIFGTDVLTGVLIGGGFADTAFRLLKGTCYPSFGYMKERGATTLWEHWNGCSSHNHPMFGGAVRHLYGGLAGIRQPEEGVGWKHVEIKPTYVPGLYPLECKLTLPTGTVQVSYREQGNTVVASVTIKGPSGSIYDSDSAVRELSQGNNEFILIRGTSGDLHFDK